MSPDSDTSSRPSDEELACRAREGCGDSFESLVRRFQVPLLRFLARRTRCEEDAEDLLQETFVRAFQRIDRYDPRWRFSTWLFTIAHRLSVSHHRRRREVSAEVREQDVSRLRSPPPAPHAELAERESRGRFWDAAAKVLSQDQLAVAWLYYVEGLSTRELEQVLGRSWVWVKTALFRARRKLEPLVRQDQAGGVRAAGAPLQSRAAAWAGGG
jgi:RNA polymerase sigma-70 factor (ECF subfamily)